MGSEEMSAHKQETSRPFPGVAIVVAMTRNGVIGNDGKLPWDLPADRRLFKNLTVGNTVIMGRRTFESLAAPLPDRRNIVISTSRRHIAGTTVCRTLAEGIALGRAWGRPIFIIGGVDIYREALAIADTLHITWVEGEVSGDRTFPDVDFSQWRAVSTDDHPGFQYSVYLRSGHRDR